MSLVILVTTQTGCKVFHRFRNTGPTPVVFETAPTRDQLLTHLQRQSTEIRQLQSDIRVSMDGMPTLRGTLAVDRPNRIRLKAGLMGMSELGVDVGSNEKRFWVWTKVNVPGQPQGIYFADHDQYRDSAMRARVPLEPQWLIDALGLVDIRTTDQLAGPRVRPDGRWELQWTRMTPTGPSPRVLILDPQRGTINQQAFYDHRGELVAFVNSIKHEYYPKYGVYLPRRIELHVVQPDGTNVQLAVDASDYRINSIYGDPDRLWAMPDPGDVPKIDLTQLAGSSVSARGASSPADGPAVADRSSYYLRDSRQPIPPTVR